jgi:hypothetical protein
MNIPRLSDARIKRIEFELGIMEERIAKTNSDKQRKRFEATVRRLMKDYDKARLLRSKENG